MIPMKIKCSICGKEESNQDLIKEVSEIIKKYSLKAEHYLNLLNLMNGKCLNSDEHSFLFDETFIKQIEEVVVKYKTNDVETETLRNNQRTLIKEVNELEIKLMELRSKEISNEQSLKNLCESDDNLIAEVESSTGIGNVTIWM